MLTTQGWGRICLFGEHQDYLRLPVIAAAINLAVTISGQPHAGREIILHLPDIGQCCTFPLDVTIPYTHERDYLSSALNVLRREGIVPKEGWECTVHGTIPINAGTSSSSALVVAWVKLLLAAAEVSRTPEEVAILANKAEVVEFGEAGGMMDHYLAALGGVRRIDFSQQPAGVERLRAPLSGFVLGNSLEKKATTGVLYTARRQAEEAFAWVTAHAPEYDPRTTSRSEFAALLPRMPPELAMKLSANLVNRDLCRQASDLLRAEAIEPEVLGALLCEHHSQLARGIGVSTPKLDAMVQAALDAGAFGAKLNGSGGGGCMFAYAPGREDAVAHALEAVGGQVYQLSMVDTEIMYNARNVE